MNAPSPSPPLCGGTRASWADHYEHLRQRGLQAGARAVGDDVEGLVLFLRLGTVSWTEDLATRTDARSASPAPPPAQGVLIHQHRFDVTQLVATMVGAAVARVQG